MVVVNCICTQHIKIGFLLKKKKNNNSLYYKCQAFFFVPHYLGLVAVTVLERLFTLQVYIFNSRRIQLSFKE